MEKTKTCDHGHGTQLDDDKRFNEIRIREQLEFRPIGEFKFNIRFTCDECKGKFFSERTVLKRR
jgi:hypothetical protein